MTDLKRGDWCAESGFLRDGKCRNPDGCTCDMIIAAQQRESRLARESDIKDCLYDSAFQAGVKLGWNFAIVGDEAGFAAATASTEHIAELKRIRAALAHNGRGE